jgi:tRNA 2-selenouridine synthase
MALQVLKKTLIAEFLRMAETIPIADVRSPSEFAAGHIPGAFNIPLFNDNEREAVGIKYKKEGRNKAILAGLELTGPLMHEKLMEALKIATEGKILVHCWRGGIRSEAMAWLFSLGGMDTEVLNGGYKSYRHYVLESLSQKRKTIILGGMTGSSKTHILRSIKSLAHQVIDLEDIANHKGSAFGALGQLPQPSTEHFANLLFDQWRKTNDNLPLWLEDESRNIGTVFMPDELFINMQTSPAIVLLMDINTRLPRLIEEYSAFPPELLKESISRISKRLGGDNARDAIGAVEKGDFAKAIEITLKYYDKTYMYSIGRKPQDKIVYVKTDTDDIGSNSLKVIEAAGKINWETGLFTVS